VARAALPGRLTWQLATVVELIDETARTKSIVLDAPEWPGHSAGQHLDVRLTAEDGYQAQRSYSIASGPTDEHLVITVERLDDGEVSPYLTDELRVGDTFELRGPIGGYFVWQHSMTRPLLMLAGGSGVVPFRSMLRDWATGPRSQAPLSTAICFSPTAAISSPHWWPLFLPAGGHESPHHHRMMLWLLRPAASPRCRPLPERGGSCPARR
jgi:NAD(P)H-flavin reductase